MLRAFSCALILAIFASCSSAEPGNSTIIRHRSDGAMPDGNNPPDSEVGDSRVPDDAATGAFEVTYTNLSSGDTLPYPIALIHGESESPASEVHVRLGVHESLWPMRDGDFFAAVRLEPGANTIELAAGEQTTTLELNYEPQTNDYAVRFIYALAKDGDGSFQAPDGEANDVTSAKQRIALGAELIQSWLGEVSNRAGHGRKTFRILRTDAGDPIVVELRSPLTRAELVQKSNTDLWYHFYDLLGSQPDRANTVDHATLAFSRYDSDTKQLTAGPSLYADRLAIHRSTHLHTWATSLDMVPDRFVDGTVIDGTTFNDDSVNRQRAWANYSTTLGLTGFQVSALFYLASTQEGGDIMDRGFDYMNRWFVIHEPVHAAGPAIDHITPEQQPMFGETNATWWSFSRYTSLQKKTYANNTPPVIKIDATNASVTGSSKLALVTVLVNGKIADATAFDSPQASHTLKIATLRDKFGAGTMIEIRTIDVDGNVASANTTL